MIFSVYCGASKGHRPEYTKAAKYLANVLVNNKIDLVYGGGNIGLMGVIADEMLTLGGKVYGVIPKILYEREVAHLGLTELFIVDNMHQRKSKIFELCDAVIAMPGGIGTMEELFEALTWNQIGIHYKPCGLLNVSGFYDAFDVLLKHMVNEGFLRTAHKDLLTISDDSKLLVEKLLSEIKPN